MTTRLLLPALALTAVSAFASTPPETPPANAHAESYGTGWECDRGDKRSGPACVGVTLPANAHLDSSGNHWACDPGFQWNVGGCLAKYD